jgi:hypothetical protein
MFNLISKIASNIGIPLVLLSDELFYNMFSSWYFHTFHHWEFIVPEDKPFMENEINSFSNSEENYFSYEGYISDTGSDYDMHEFESYYYKYVF